MHISPLAAGGLGRLLDLTKYRSGTDLQMIDALPQSGLLMCPASTLPVASPSILTESLLRTLEMQSAHPVETLTSYI